MQVSEICSQNFRNLLRANHCILAVAVFENRRRFRNVEQNEGIVYSMRLGEMLGNRCLCIAYD